MVIVNDEYRGLGLGKIVTQKCIESVSNNVASMLIATEEGKPMYEKLGFISRDNIHKFLCVQYVLKETVNGSNYSIIPMEKKDLTQILKIDKDAFGVDRKNFLINRMNQSKDSLVVKNIEGEIIGYGLSILGPVNLILGPVVANNPETAILILDHLVKNYQGKYRIDVPSGHEKFMSYLKERGFVQVSQPPIMVNHSMQLPPRNNTYFGIASQAFG
jgi:predicted N-acetyltransferase YhbS